MHKDQNELEAAHLALLAHFPDWRGSAEADDRLEAKVFLHDGRGMRMVSTLEPDGRITHVLGS